MADQFKTPVGRVMFGQPYRYMIFWKRVRISIIRDNHLVYNDETLEFLQWCADNRIVFEKIKHRVAGFDLYYWGQNVSEEKAILFKLRWC